MNNSYAPPESQAAISTGPLTTDTVFWGLLATQFLGAFNDNYFKQMVLLKCTDVASGPGGNLQWMAMAAFALPFVLLSGLGGYLSDRISKRTVIVACKFLEIVVMAAALLVLWLQFQNPSTELRWLILVLALMGAQSAIFGPSKYGILPELFHQNRLLPVNGGIQMTTFLAIIFGMATAGIALDSMGKSLWVGSMIAVAIAVIGTLTSLVIRRTPVAAPTSRLEFGNLFVPGDIRRLIFSEPDLLKALLVATLFWFLGGVAQPGVNDLGKNTLLMNDTRTSLMVAFIGFGIAAGCVVAGFANRSKLSGDGARWTKIGSWSLLFSLVLISLLASGMFGRPEPSAETIESIWWCFVHANGVEHALRFSMMCLGVSAGIFVVPIQVFVQAKPPADQKGRLIGSMNFMTWIGILLSAVWLLVFNQLVAFLPNPVQHQYLLFVSLAVLILPVALFYRLPGLPQSVQET